MNSYTYIVQLLSKVDIILSDCDPINSCKKYPSPIAMLDEINPFECIQLLFEAQTIKVLRNNVEYFENFIFNHFELGDC